jgi:putative membrane protein
MSNSGGMSNRTLILCIDGDNDIGKKTTNETPIFGREENLQAALDLAIKDPEEADANAMFGAIKLYDQLTERYSDEVYQVATIAGSDLGRIEADRKIVNELENVLNSFNAKNVILVTDGYSDQTLIPLVQSRVPITSIQTVVVKHSERIEETWAVIFRYLKMLIEDPYYSRVALGVPGIMLVILGVLLIFNQLQNAGLVLTFVMGLVLVIRGFGLDEKLSMLRRLPSPNRQLVIASQSVGVILGIVGSIRGVTNASQFVPANAPAIWVDFSYWLGITPTLLGAFLLKSIDLIILGSMVVFIGGVASNYITKDSKIWQNIVGIIISFWLRFIAIESAKVLIEPETTLTLWSPLILITLAGVITTITSVFLIYNSYKKFPFQ